jgi:hypothetical protein
VDHVDESPDSAPRRGCLPVKLLMVTAAIASSRDPRAYHYNILL